MYICPMCNQEFNKEENMRSHLLQCWKEQHPYYQSKTAPHSEDIETKEVNDDIMNFFKGLK